MAETRSSVATAMVSTDWLAKNLSRADIKVLDARFFPPTDTRDKRTDYDSQHIAGAIFFDIDAIADQKTPLPHMLPSEDDFGRMVGALGISNADTLIVYDSLGLFSAARVWWMFRVMGHQAVYVLDGGLPKWLSENRPVSTDVPAFAPQLFAAHFQKKLIKTAEEVAHESDRSTLIDARSQGRFSGAEPEIWPGRRAGHIPGACNVFFGSLIDPTTKTLLPRNQLAARFAEIDLARPVTVTCGSGVTACVLALALYEIGYPDAAVYDGSWAEWGLPESARPETTGTKSGRPIEVGALSKGDKAL